MSRVEFSEDWEGKRALVKTFVNDVVIPAEREIDGACSTK